MASTLEMMRPSRTGDSTWGGTYIWQPQQDAGTDTAHTIPAWDHSSRISDLEVQIDFLRKEIADLKKLEERKLRSGLMEDALHEIAEAAPGEGNKIAKKTLGEVNSKTKRLIDEAITGNIPDE